METVEKIVILKKPASYDETLGPTCENICDVVYFILCDDCASEHACHTNGVDHNKLLDCALKHLQDKRNSQI
jgi:hypothetical protein